MDQKVLMSVGRNVGGKEMSEDWKLLLGGGRCG